MPGLEAFLTKAVIPFDLKTDGKGEFDPCWTAFRSGQDLTNIATNSEGQPVTLVANLVPLEAALRNAVAAGQSGDAGGCLANAQVALQLVENELAIVPAPLPPFEMVR